MPITQDRMIALVAAAEHYHNLLFKLQESILKTISADGIAPITRLTMIYEEVIALNLPMAVRETILMEKAHFAATHKRNDRKRSYAERQRMLKQPDISEQVTGLLRSSHLAEPATRHPRPDYLEQASQGHGTVSEEELAAQILHDTIMDQGRKAARAITQQEGLSYHEAQRLALQASSTSPAPFIHGDSTKDHKDIDPGRKEILVNRALYNGLEGSEPV